MSSATCCWSSWPDCHQIACADRFRKHLRNRLTGCTSRRRSDHACQSEDMSTPAPGPIPVTGVAHLRLTVTDLARSRAFYDAVFGWDVAYELPADADEATRRQLWFLFGGIIYSFPGGGLFGLRPVAPGSDAFSPDRVGLDHLALNLAGPDELRGAIAVLDGLGVEHESVKDLGEVSILEFRDPDGIALELSAPNG